MFSLKTLYGILENVEALPVRKDMSLMEVIEVHDIVNNNKARSNKGEEMVEFLDNTICPIEQCYLKIALMLYSRYNYLHVDSLDEAIDRIIEDNVAVVATIKALTTVK